MTAMPVTEELPIAVEAQTPILQPSEQHVIEVEAVEAAEQFPVGAMVVLVGVTVEAEEEVMAVAVAGVQEEEKAEAVAEIPRLEEPEEAPEPGAVVEREEKERELAGLRRVVLREVTAARLEPEEAWEAPLRPRMQVLVRVGVRQPILPKVEAVEEVYMELPILPNYFSVQAEGYHPTLITHQTAVMAEELSIYRLKL